MTLGEYFKTIADSIRAKTGGTATINASVFAPTIRGFLNFSDVKSVSGNRSAQTYYYDPTEKRSYTFVAECGVEGIHVQNTNVLELDVRCYIRGADGGHSETQTLKIILG